MPGSQTSVSTNISLSNSNNAFPVSSDSAPSDKARNETYFEKMGAENANRPEDLPPSQGGRYTGFGSTCQSALLF